MADITVTVTDLELSATSKTTKVQFGEAGTAGETFYLKAADGKYWKAVNATEEAAAAVGILTTPKVAADGYGNLHTSGDITIGATLATGTVYVVSSTSGAIHPTDDLATTEWVTIVGTAFSTTVLRMGINATGAQHV